ncbi:hypothetical protein [Bacillus sp. FJAT-45350]|uniref:hypothetical protein n=1 Tax=Bacillus sp. FJAT-45350 TaxID=2011014 RepID=UPI0015CD636D|nr:hypothetical protein [Bacillus sp. FJAT-45350]
MEDQQHEFVLILAGYSKEMDYFLSLNPGLPSRFPISIDFPDYSTDELMEIGSKLLEEREYWLATEGEWKVREHLRKIKTDSGRTFSNGRYIRNLIEQAIRSQAVRLLTEGKYDRQSLAILAASDFDFEHSTVRPYA